MAWAAGGLVAPLGTSNYSRRQPGGRSAGTAGLFMHYAPSPRSVPAPLVRFLVAAAAAVAAGCHAPVPPAAPAEAPAADALVPLPVSPAQAAVAP